MTMPRMLWNASQVWTGLAMCATPLWAAAPAPPTSATFAPGVQSAVPLGVNDIPPSPLAPIPDSATSSVPSSQPVAPISPGTSSYYANGGSGPLPYSGSPTGAIYRTPGGYEARIGSPYHYFDPNGGQYVVTGDPYYDHWGPGFHRQSLHGHYRFPYYNYRAPWYYPGRAVYQRDTNFAW